MKNHFKTKQGYSLVEMVLYVSILSVFFIIIVNSLLSFTKPYREILALRVVERSGLDSMERIVREVRAATTVDTANSTLSSSPGVLSLVSTYNNISTTTKFYISNNVLNVDVNGVYQGPLSAGSTSITNLTFYHLTNGVSSAIKINMTIEAVVGNVTKTKKYSTTVVLRGV